MAWPGVPCSCLRRTPIACTLEGSVGVLEVDDSDDMQRRYVHGTQSDRHLIHQFKRDEAPDRDVGVR